MANYDSPAQMYDSGLVYDAPALPQERSSSKMAKVKLGLVKLSPDELVSRANQIKTAMTGNANFATPNPSLTSIGTAITAAANKIALQKSAALAALQATTDRDAALDALKALLVQLGAYVENTSGGDASKIQSAGMSVKAPLAPIGPLAQVQSLALSAGDNDGELDATWDPVRGARSYQVQVSAEPISPTSWRDVAPVSKSRKALSGLPSGSRTWVRVRAIAAKEEFNGGWSDPAVKTVP